MHSPTLAARRAYAGALLTLFFPGRLASSKTIAATLLDQAQQAVVLEQQNKRWLLINLWATWCPPCLEEIPDLVSLYSRRAELSLNLVGVAYDWKPDDRVSDQVERLRKRFRIPYPIVPAHEANLKWFGQDPSIPSSLLIRPDGKVHALHSGAITDQMVRSVIRNKR